MPHPIANDCEADNSGPDAGTPARGSGYMDLFEMWAGSGFSPLHVYVWARSFDDAFEEMVDYFDDKGQCGIFTEVGDTELREAANTLGIPWESHWPDHGDPEFTKVSEYAEIDLTHIGHTTLDCQKQAKGSLYIASTDWGGQEVIDAKKVEEVARRSKKECHGHSFLMWDIVKYNGEYFEVTDSGDPLEIRDDSGDEELEFEGHHMSKAVMLVEANKGETDQLEKYVAAHSPSTRTEPAPRRAPTFGPVTEGASGEEKARMADFFFPKSTLPKSRKGGGGFMGLKKKR